MYISEGIKSLLSEDKNQTEGGYYVFHWVEAYFYKQSVKMTRTKHDKRYHNRGRIKQYLSSESQDSHHRFVISQEKPNQTNSPNPNHVKELGKRRP